MENVGNEHSKAWFFKVSRDPGDHTPKPLRIITPTHAKSSLGTYASFWYPEPHPQEKGGKWRWKICGLTGQATYSKYH